MSKDAFVQGSSSNRSRITNYKLLEDEEDSEDEANKLWTVLGIVAERKKSYKIRWEGNDPATGKPWPNSWTRKEDVTGDVIEEWLALPEEERRRRTEEEDRFEKEEKKKTAKFRKSKGSARRASTKSTAKSRRGSTTSTAQSSKKRGDDSRPDQSTVPKQEPISISLSSLPAKPAARKSKGKKRSHDDSLSGAADPPGFFPESNGRAPATKKQKTSHPAVEREEEEEEAEQPQYSEDEVEDTLSPARKPEPPLSKKKLAKTNSTRIQPVRVTRDPSPYSDDEPPPVKVGPPKKVKKQQVADQPKKPPRGPTSVLSPEAMNRLERFDIEMKLLDERDGETSEHTTASPIVYAESDVDSEAAGLMYPPESEEPSRWKGKERRAASGDTDLEEVPETQSPRTEALHLTPSRRSVIGSMKRRTPHSGAASKDSLMFEMFDIQPGELLGQPPLPKPARAPAAAAAPTKRKDIFPKKPVPAASTSKPNGIAPTKRKILGPIPVVSPSKFTPHLPSSLQDSVIEDPDGSQRPHPSSAEQIEQFDSPDKSSRSERVVINEASNSKGKGRARDDDKRSPFSSDHGVLVKGQELAERARRPKTKQPRLTLDEIRERARSASKTQSPEAQSHDSDDQEFQPPTPRSQDQEFDDEEQDEPEFQLPGSSPPPQDADETQQEFEAEEDDDEGLEYVDEPQAPIVELDFSFDAQQAPGAFDTMTQQDEDAATQGPIAPAHPIPEEEEESTQDLLAELEVLEAISQPGSPSPEPPPRAEATSKSAHSMPPPVSSKPLSSQDAMDQDANVSMVPQPGTQLSQAVVPDLAPPLPPVRARHPSKEPVASEQAVQGSSQEIPATSSTTNQDSQETNGSAKSAPNPSQLEELKRALALLNVKSEEIAQLEKSLADQKLKVHEMTGRFDASTQEWTARLETDLLQLKVQHDSDLERLKNEHAAERATWAEEKYQLEIAVQSAGDRKALAERDCERFRDEYMRASGTVGQLRAEKHDLEKELGIAQAQAKSGVLAVRALFEGRVEDLTKQRDSWQRTAEFIIEKDRRTNDDIRKRAAEEPELRAKYQRYRIRSRELEVKVEDGDEEIRILREEVNREKQENERLRQALRALEGDGAAPLQAPPISRHNSAAASTLTVNRPVVSESRLTEHTSPQASSGNEEEDNDDDDDDDDSEFDDDAQVYRCQWRSRAAHGHFCNRLFATLDELRAHMSSARDHLPPSPHIDGLD
ncbi:hypothetical protein BKA70DRAFT_175746 [Coprinopsis sp. MPI-PUGE-AT-0042]|nr:hypothetical protein BKA70DRAFT_175746 [Coprinopsis sp. MPI-PUGE-AT-0042]